MDFNNKKNIKTFMLLIFGCILFYLGVQNISIVAKSLSWLLDMLFPFVLGSGIAFVLNVPMTRIEYHLFKKHNRQGKFHRPISFVVTLALVIGIIIIAIYIVVPQLADTIRTIGQQLPDAFAATEAWIISKMSYWKELQVILQEISLDWDEIIGKVSVMLQDMATAMLDSGIGAISNIIGALVNFFIGFVFAIYILMAKERLGGQGKQVIYAFFKEQQADKILNVCSISYKIFAKFISGQCLEACILGTMFVVAMTIFKLPYAMLIGVLIAFCALIPIVGAFIGCFVGAFLILMISPIKALVFVILFLVLQQIEGNLVYPHVVGNSVGLPSIWVLAAVTIGGNLMGVAGMILFIPLCSVAYTLFRMFVKNRLAEKGVSKEKWEVNGTN